MVKMLRILLFIVLFFEKCKPARILGIFPAPVISHQYVFKALTQELAKRGHQVTVITTFSVTEDRKIDNYTEIVLTRIGTEARHKVLLHEVSKVPDMFSQFKIVSKASFQIMEDITQTKQVKDLIKNERFELIFIEDCTKSALIFSHLVKAPAILVSSFGGSYDTFETVGAVVHPILHPLATRKKFHDLSMWEKISEMYTLYQLQKIYKDFELMQNEIYKKYYGLRTPTLDVLKENVHMLFLNIHPIWDSNRPVPPNVIYLGGLHQSPQEELPKELKSSLDSSSRGVIYVSFGTTVDDSIFSESTLKIFINVFSKLPYDVYWKWSDDKLPELSKNVKLFKWFPQADLLRHPKVKLFITQGGLQSTDEAISAGVPLLGLPILWDQWFNVDKYVQLKIGIQLNIETLTEDALHNAIETLIDNTEYKSNIMKLRSIMLDSRQSSLDRAVWWTEYVLRHGAVHLRTPSANMSWIDYYEIKTILFGIFILIFSIVSVLIVLRYILFIIMKLYHSNKIKIH